MNSREKGKRGERQWRDELRANGYGARRGQQFSGSADSPDVVCDALSWIHFEVKAVERLNIEEAMEQARRDCGKVEGRGQKSEVGARRAEVGGQKSEGRGQRAEVRGQRSEGRGRRAEVRGQRAGFRSWGRIWAASQHATFATPHKLAGANKPALLWHPRLSS